MDASLSEVAQALVLVSQRVWKRELTAWLYVPTGIVIVLLACWGVDSLIGLSSVSFPASVALMLVLLVVLLLCQRFLGDRRTKIILRFVDIPCGFALRWISIFFTPSFVTLPLSPSVSGVEIGKIIGVFLIGFFAMFIATAYLVRFLLIIFGTSKRAVIERAEEMGNENDSIPLSVISNEPSPADGTPTPTNEVGGGLEDLIAPDPARHPDSVRATHGPPIPNGSPSTDPAVARAVQMPPPLSREQVWATHISLHLDFYTYIIFFVFIGLPVYYATGYPMPEQICLNVLAYLCALALPPKWKRFLHPVLVSSAFTIMALWILALTRQQTLQQALHAYSTSTRYTQLWDGEKGLRKPGAGDVFSSILDVSIVALALPMFQYRQELQRHMVIMLLPLLPLVGLSMFGYPAFCKYLLDNPHHSLAFTARSLTLALATPTSNNLSGDASLVAVVCIMSGILGVLFGPTLLRWIRIPEDDYVTRGLTIGANSSAIGTAMLLTTDPRAAALSSLIMSLFGTVMVAMSSVPPLVTIIQQLAGL